MCATYGAVEDDVRPMVCDVEIHSGHDTSREEMRARRLYLRQGKTAKKLRPDLLHDELFVVIGPDMSTRAAVNSLRAVIKKIDKGLLIGEEMPDGDYLYENVEGSISR